MYLTYECFVHVSPSTFLDVTAVAWWVSGIPQRLPPLIDAHKDACCSSRCNSDLCEYPEQLTHFTRIVTV